MPIPPACFALREGELHCEDIPLASLATRYGTPLYVYSQAMITARMAELRNAFGPETIICYAVKANSNLSILRLLHRLGAGFDVVSGGELLRLDKAGIPADRTVFAGVAKETWEIEKALDLGIRAFHPESLHELPMLAKAAAARKTVAPVALRLNPDVDPKTHRHITTGTLEDKFGFDFDVAAEAVRVIHADPHLRLVGYHMHLGSQLASPTPYLQAFDRICTFLDQDPMRTEGVESFDLGGGFGIPYQKDEQCLDVVALAAALLPRLKERGQKAIIEPGRYLVAESGVLLTTVLGLKSSGQKRFVLVDAAMNDLLRPALYDAYHEIMPVRPRAEGKTDVFDVVGPICESGDFLAQKRMIEEPRAGDVLAVACAGAYGASMAGNYNSRRRPAEVLVHGADARVIRRRESFDDMMAAEIL